MQYYTKESTPGSKWNKLQTFLSFSSSFVLSVFSIYWNYKDVKNEKGLSVLNNWPSFKIPIIAMMFTYLIALSFVQEYKLENNKVAEYKFSSAVIGFLFGVMPFIGLLLYPGLDQLHLSSDPYALGLFLAFNVTQTFLLYRELQRGLGYEFDLTTVAVGVAINLVVVMVSPYAHYLSGGSGRYNADIHGE